MLETWHYYITLANDLFITLATLGVGIGIVAVAVVYVVDRSQSKHAVRRNFPVIGRFRYMFEHLGEFFRQYFFASDREEMPFNRAQRTWVYRAAKNIDNTVAFGSTHDLRPPGTVLFVNCPFPVLAQDAVEPEPMTIGADCPQPFVTKSIFNVSGMSYGALSKPAVLALTAGAREAGCWVNTGEGALSPYHLEAGCDLVFQIGTAKFGVRDEDGNLSDEKLREVAAHEAVRMFEIKMSQGAKPGKGGILPASKITPEIAKMRGIPMGQDAISPNRHPDIASPGDLLDMILRVREVTGKPVGFKTVIGSTAWLEGLFEMIMEMGLNYAPDFITVDSADGGTGAAPQSLIDHMGIPIQESLPMMVDMIHKHGLEDRIKVIASGKLVTASSVAWALCAGADFVASARGFMFALGCVQALQCNKNTCPTGVATHDPRLQKGLVPGEKSVRVANYVRNMVREVGVIGHSCGVPAPRRLRRSHCRIVTSAGKSVPLDTLYPDPREDRGSCSV